jgi:hypothetical protein
MLDTKLGRSLRHRELKLFPIIALNPAPLPYRLMAEALADRTLLITEVGSGSETPSSRPLTMVPPRCESTPGAPDPGRGSLSRGALPR